MKSRDSKYIPPKVEIIRLETEQCFLVQSGSNEDLFEDLDDFSDFFE